MRFVGSRRHLIGRRVTAASSFSPVDLFGSGEKGGWWDGADLTKMDQTTTLGTTPVVSNGDPIGYWGDKSGNTNHVTQATAGAKPVLSANGIDFVSSDFLRSDALANAIASTDLWACAVVSMDTLVDGARVISASGATNDDFDAAAGGILLFFQTDTNKFKSYQGSGMRGVASSAQSATTKYLAESSWSGTENTITVAGSAGTPVAATNTFDIRKLGFGSYQTVFDAGFLDGQIAEVIIIDRIPNGTELTNIRSYLNTKWSI